ncbi:MAG: thymidine phosphorylase family protein [Pseudomonadales bacterium]
MTQPLNLRRIAIDTYHENVAYLHRSCPLYRSEGFQALTKIEIRRNHELEPVIAVLNIVDDEGITAPDELGLSEQTFAQLGAEEGSAVYVSHAVPPTSLRAVHAKIAGERLTEADFFDICSDITKRRYSKIEIAAFLVGCSESGLEREEIYFLTKAMVDTGDRLDWGEPVVVDKHCIGGVPGNRTSMVIVPIVAAHGMLFPKTSSRAITSPAGTADTMEMLARVDLSLDELRGIVHQHRGFLAWGGTANLAPADDILISVERPLAMDSTGQMIASILSKKLAAGSTHLLIDIPVGPTAKVRSQAEALRLRKLFEFVGDRVGMRLEVAITDGSQPVGNGIGPALEARDVMRVLQNHPLAPLDLKEKSLRLAGRMLEFDADVRGGQGYRLARDLLESGRALAKMESIIDAQGRHSFSEEPARFAFPVVAPSAGIVAAIDNLQLARIARLAGAPMDGHSGIDLHKKLNDPVQQDEPLYTLYAEFPPDFQFARDAAAANAGYRVRVGR